AHGRRHHRPRPDRRGRLQGAEVGELPHGAPAALGGDEGPQAGAAGALLGGPRPGHQLTSAPTAVTGSRRSATGTSRPSSCAVHHRAVAARAMLATADSHITGVEGWGVLMAMIVGKPAPRTSKAKLAGKTANRAR